MARRQYTGGAPKTTLAAAITSITPPPFLITDGTGYPTGATPFGIVISRGLANEEKKLVTRSGNTLTVVTNGFDNTTAATHLQGADVEHCVTGVDLDEANSLFNLADAKGDIIAATAADTWARVAAGADDTMLMYDSAQTAGVKAAASAAPSGAFSTSSSAGTADTWLRSDAQFTLFDATVPVIDGTAATGSAAVAARRDHVHPGATLGYAQVTADQNALSPSDLTGLSAAVTVAAGHRIKITGFVHLRSSVAGDAMVLQIKEGAATLQTASIHSTTSAQSDVVRAEVILTPSTGAHTYKLTAGREAGTGTVDMVASSSRVAFILAEDIGV